MLYPDFNKLTATFIILLISRLLALPLTSYIIYSILSILLLYYELENGDYRKFTVRTCKLIPIEIDRLEYLISYCLKNYYIKHANFVADGEYIPKWRYDNLADAARLDYENKNDEVAAFRNEAESLNDCGHYERIINLELQYEVLYNKLQKIKNIV